MSLLVSSVFGDEVKVFSANDEGTVHLGGNNGAGQDTTSDGNETSEGALLVNIGSLNCSLWCSESQSYVLVPSSSTFSNLARLGLRLAVEEDMRLLLESPFGLNSEFGCHDCGSWFRESQVVEIGRAHV